MKEILLTSSVLIIALLALRRLFRRTISRRMQYALWLLVLARLLVPVNVGTLAHNVLTAAAPVQTAVEERLDTPVLYVQDGTERRPAQLVDGSLSQNEPLSPPSGAAQTAPADEYYTVTPTYRTVTLSEALTYIWYAGIVGVGAWFLFTNLRFARTLHRTRTPYPVEGCRYPVYLVPELPSPCLFGVLRPAVYLNEKALQSPDALRFVLAHEQTHARHLDPLWSLLRGVCLTVYWFDPLVWLAAVLSREDCELACDEGTLRALGADERAAYGKTLLALVPVCDKPQNPLLGATTMTSGKRSLKERITRIAENRQAKAAAVFAVVALAALVCAVSFTGAPDTPPEVTQEWYDAGFTAEDAQACLEFLDWAEELDGKREDTASWGALRSGKLGVTGSEQLLPRPEVLARLVRNIRAEELSPLKEPAGEMLCAISVNDGRGAYAFVFKGNGQICLSTSGEDIAVVDNAALSALFDYLRGVSPFSEEELNDCLAFLCWASAFDAADVTGIGTWDAATSAAHFLTDDLAGVAAQLQPVLRRTVIGALEPVSEAEEPLNNIQYTVTVTDSRSQYSFALSESGAQISLICPDVQEAEGRTFALWRYSPLADVFAPLFSPAPSNTLSSAQRAGLTAEEAGTVEEFLAWAQDFRAADAATLAVKPFAAKEASAYPAGQVSELLLPLEQPLRNLNAKDIYAITDGPYDHGPYALELTLGDARGSWTLSCGPSAFPVCLVLPNGAHAVSFDAGLLADAMRRFDTGALPDFEAAEPTPLVDILPAQEPWLTIPLADAAKPFTGRVPVGEYAFFSQLDMDGDGVCEIVNTYDVPALYYERGGTAYRVDLKSVITAAWPELYYWGYTFPASRSILLGGLSAGDAPGDGVNFMRYLYFDGENLLLYKRDRSHTDHVADATLADPSVPAEVVARAKQLVQRRYDTLLGDAAQYDDDWYTDVSFLGTETRYAGLTLEVYSFSQYYHAQKPENIPLAGGTDVDEDGWAVLDGDTVLDGPYIVCLMDGGTRRMLEGSMYGDCGTGSYDYYVGLTGLLVKNGVLRPDDLDGDKLNEVMESGGLRFLDWLGEYDAAEQDRALERLSAYRASLTDSYTLERFSLYVDYLCGDLDGLTDAGRAAQERFRAKFE